MVIIANLTLLLCSLALAMYIYTKIKSIIRSYNKLDDECSQYRSTLKRISRTRVLTPLDNKCSDLINNEQLRINKLEAFSSVYSGDLKRKQEKDNLKLKP